MGGVSALPRPAEFPGGAVPAAGEFSTVLFGSFWIDRPRRGNAFGGQRPVFHRLRRFQCNAHNSFLQSTVRSYGEGRSVVLVSGFKTCCAMFTEL